MTADSTSAATRLCTACGMCCNGVMFHTVRMQPADFPKVLVGLGLKLKRKKKQQYFQQPCPAFKNNQCSIYLQRPERCRLFECRQLLRVEAGETTEAAALESIEEAQKLVRRVTELLHLAGKTDERRPLSKRYEKIMVDLEANGHEPAAVAQREDLTQAMGQLNTLLNEQFRLEPIEL